MNEKKKTVALRLNPQIISELKERSAITGISQARIVESALDKYFESGMNMELWNLCAMRGMCMMNGCQARKPGGLFGVPDLTTIIGELVKSKRIANRREVYVKSLEFYLGRFVKEVGGIIHEISHEHIEGFLSRFNQPYTRQTWLNRVSVLFSYAVRRGYITSNPCDRIDRITIDRSAPVILSVDQSRKLLSTCPDSCRAYLILGMFAGIRPDEIHRLDWKDVSLDSKTVRVDGKTRQRRFVPLEQIAVDLIAPIVKESGPVAPSRSTVRRWKRNAREIFGGKWTADILRHTAASYLLARHQDAAKVALWLGNSPKILMRHYAEPVSQSDAVAFWQGIK